MAPVQFATVHIESLSDLLCKVSRYITIDTAKDLGAALEKTLD